MLELMRVMANGAVADMALAGELGEEAAYMEDAGHPAVASALRERAIHHRVKGLELDARMAALSIQYKLSFVSYHEIND